MCGANLYTFHLSSFNFKDIKNGALKFGIQVFTCVSYSVFFFNLKQLL